MDSRRHVVFIQHGNYAEAVERFAAGGDENYASQRYSVELVASFARKARVTVICLPVPAGEQQMPSGVVSIGLGWKSRRNVLALIGLLERLDVTDLVLRTPLSPVLAWAVARRKRVLPLLADSFQDPGSRRLSRSVLVRLLNSKRIPVVANHNMSASCSLAKIGVDARKIVPWDWPQGRTPSDRTPKQRPEPNAPLSIFYAGVISEAKGVTDLVLAVGCAARNGVDVRLQAAGAGELDRMNALAASCGVADRVTFLGRIPNPRVFELMCESDVVVVPSRPAYPEGLPIVITEGLCSRSPVLLSDHPVFSRAFAGQAGVRFFKAGDPESLGAALQAVAEDPLEYERLSQEGAAAWKHTQLGLTWGELVERWLSASPGDLEFLKGCSLPNLRAEPCAD